MRRKDREIKETDEILRIAESAKILHLGLSDGDFPYVVPLHYGFEYTDKALVFYTHGAADGHKINLIRADGAFALSLNAVSRRFPAEKSRAHTVRFSHP